MPCRALKPCSSIPLAFIACIDVICPANVYFVDLRKAYDSVPRDTLWRILHVYGVHTKLIELLMDLHTGTQAAVRMGGVVSEWFDVHGGVRQGCVIAPLLFNIYMDFVVRQAMAQMPEGCGVKLAYHADGKLERDGCGSGGCVELLSVLLYADDMVLLSPSREELVVMLQVMDKVAASLGLRINASKTEILSIDKDWKEGDVPVQQGPEVVISEGVVKEVSQFKYLGSVLVTDGRLDVELNIRRGKAVGRFKQFEKMWGTKHLSLATKVKCYKAYVLPILLFGSECWSLTKVQSQKLERVHSSCLRSILRFKQFEKMWGTKHLSLATKVKCYKAYVLPILLFGSECWSLTKVQSQKLERVHSSCLRSILGVRLSDRHTNEHIRKSCGVATLSAYITANRLRWLGHVGRMEEGRLPHIALFSSLHGDMTRPVGRPRHTWEKCVCADLKVLGQDEGSWEASCQIKSAWRKRLWDLTHPWESQRLGVEGALSKLLISMWSAMWCLSVAGRMVVHQYLGGGSHLQPLLGWCWILLPPRHPCVMEVEQVLGFSGGVCFPLVCTPLHLASACVWQIHHRLCGFVIVIRSLVFVA